MSASLRINSIVGACNQMVLAIGKMIFVANRVIHIVTITTVQTYKSQKFYKIILVLDRQIHAQIKL